MDNGSEALEERIYYGNRTKVGWIGARAFFMDEEQGQIKPLRWELQRLQAVRENN